MNSQKENRKERTGMKKLAFVLTVACCGMAWAINPVGNVVAKQGSLGSGLVEISFDLATVQAESQVTISAVDAVKSMALSVKTLQDAAGNKLNNPCTLKAGAHHTIYWDALTDLGKTFYSASVSITVKAAVTKPTAEGLYCVIDLSSGPDSTRYPVTYLNEIPGGAWSDEYKTTKLVLKKLPPGSFVLGETKQPITLTKYFYMGVFEVTDAQYALVMGDDKQLGQNQTFWTSIRGLTGTFWPLTTKVDANSFVGRLKMRTGIDFDLPTEEQWEYACTTGTGFDGMLTDPAEWCIDYYTYVVYGTSTAQAPFEGIVTSDEDGILSHLVYPVSSLTYGSPIYADGYAIYRAEAYGVRLGNNGSVPAVFEYRVVRGSDGSPIKRTYGSCGGYLGYSVYGFRLSWTVQ